MKAGGDFLKTGNCARYAFADQAISYLIYPFLLERGDRHSLDGDAIYLWEGPKHPRTRVGVHGDCADDSGSSHDRLDWKGGRGRWAVQQFCPHKSDFNNYFNIFIRFL